MTRRRFYRSMPFFYGYVCFGLGNDLVLYIIQHSYSSHYFQAYFVQTCIDSALQYGILVELAWCVLRPLRASLPRGTLPGLSLLILTLGAACWPLSIHRNVPPAWQFISSLMQCVSVLRILFFVVLVAGSHLLALGWRDREFQVATGLGSFSLVSFAATLIHAHQKMGIAYHRIDVLVCLSYAGSLLYWAVSFAQAEAPRRDFTPQMRDLLVTMAAAMRTTLSNKPA